MSQGGEKMLRVNVAAKRLGFTDRYIRKLVRQGKIDYFRASARRTFIPESAVEAFREHSENS